MVRFAIGSATAAERLEDHVHSRGRDRDRGQPGGWRRDGPAPVAVSDGLRTYDAELVVAIRHPTGAGRYLEDVPLQQAAETFGVRFKEVAVQQAR